VFADGDVSYIYLQHNNIYIVALTRRNSNVTSVFVFLERLTEILREYFGTLEEESIRDNFVLIYELLDEVMDFGYPQVAEVKVLKEYILQGARKLDVQKPPQAVTNQVSWRTEGIVYKKNEVFLDVVEKLNLLVAANGSVLNSEILGSIKMRTCLTGACAALRGTRGCCATRCARPAGHLAGGAGARAALPARGGSRAALPAPRTPAHTLQACRSSSWG